ncbi:hypothetical protein KJ765_06515 [Candidatus Micrarchaeota archaeon]|nr:hypothetical protein [Candidatus Micrarchaeota archaeon]
MRHAIFLVIFLLFLSGLHAEDVDLQPKMIGSATAIVTLNWSVDLGSQQVSELSIKSFGFKDYPSQRVLSEETSLFTSFETDDYGNKIRLFTLDPGKPFQTFGMVSQVHVGFPLEFKRALPAEAEYYLQESPYIRLTPEIREMARQLTHDETTDWNRLIVLSLWVHNNLAYDTALISVTNDAEEVFRDRVGTCDEFSHLLIAMLRSVGIPAKFSAAFVYSGTDWGAHAFVEALIEDEWIPVDPTFNEAMLLDATHIKFGEGLDQQDIKEDILIRSFNADVGQIKLTRSFNVEFTDTQPFPKYFDMELDVTDKRVGSHSLETVWLTVRNRDRRLAVPLTLNVPSELDVLGPDEYNHDKLLFLQPYEERTVGWKVLVPQLDEGYVYTFPIEVISLGQRVVKMLNASKGGERTQEERVEILSVSTDKNGGVMNLSILIKNTGNQPLPDVNVSLTAPGFNETRSLRLRTGEVQDVPFSLYVGTAKELRASVSIRIPSHEFSQALVVAFEEPAPTPEVFEDDLSGIPFPRDMILVALGILLFLIFLFIMSRVIHINVQR